MAAEADPAAAGPHVQQAPGSRPPGPARWGPAGRAVLGSPGLRLSGRRLLAAIPVLWGVTFLTFVLMNLLPGNAAQELLGANATPAEVRALELKLHLNEPFWTRYWHWLSGVLHGDLGDVRAGVDPGHPLDTEGQNEPRPGTHGAVIPAQAEHDAALVLVDDAKPTQQHQDHNGRGRSDDDERQVHPHAPAVSRLPQLVRRWTRPRHGQTISVALEHAPDLLRRGRVGEPFANRRNGQGARRVSEHGEDAVIERCRRCGRGFAGGGRRRHADMRRARMTLAMQAWPE